MNRIKELLKDKKVVAGVVAAVVVLFAVGGTTVYFANSKDGGKTTAAETQNTQVTTSAKTTEKTTAAMEIAQAQFTGAGETIATETAVEVGNVENESGVSEETEAEQKPETEETSQPEETPHGEEAVSENTGNDAEEEKEPEVVEDTASEPEEAPASEPTLEPAPEPETEAAPTLTDEERLVATGKWVFDSAWDTPRGHVNCYYYTDAITGYKIDVSFGDGKYSSCSTSGSEDLRAIFDAHGISLDGKKVNIDLMLML